MGNNPSVRRRPSGRDGPAAPPGATGDGGGYPGAQAPPPMGPGYVHPNMYGGQRNMPAGAGGIQGLMPYVDGARPAELRGQNLYPWRPMPRQVRSRVRIWRSRACPTSRVAGSSRCHGISHACQMLAPRPSKQAVPQMQKTYTIKNDVNLKKNTLKVVPESNDKGKYYVEFDFDATTACKVTVFFVATEKEGQLNT